jgi:peptidoglycan/xylan/chitin deacetylase (PgdA/CDA1 family)
MQLYFTKTPKILSILFKKYIWRFSSDKKEIYLTFDDGPTPEITEFVLEQLDSYNAKATFFCIGKNIQEHPEIFNQIIARKHRVGNHTQNHFNGWKHTKDAYLKNVLACESNLQASQENPKLFRPPYGKIKKSQAKELLKNGYEIIMWDVLSADFDTTISKEACFKNVVKNAQNGSVIVFHDSVKAAEKLKYALPKVLEEFSKRGFVFLKI